MTPRILEFEDKRVKVTAAAFAIPEIKALLDKYGNNAEPYLTFVHAMAATDSPYINIPEEERLDAAVYEIQATLGDFDYGDPLVDEAIENLKKKYHPPMFSLAVEMGEELHRFRKKLQSEELTMGANGNFKDRFTLMKDISKIALEYQKVKKMADDEIQAATKGGHALGEY